MVRRPAEAGIDNMLRRNYEKITALVKREKTGLAFQSDLTVISTTCGKQGTRR